MSWDKVSYLSIGDVGPIPDSLTNVVPGGIPGGVPDPTKLQEQLLSECARDPSCKTAYFSAAQMLKGTSYEWCLGCPTCSACVKNKVDNPTPGELWSYMSCLEGKAMYDACGVPTPGAHPILSKVTDFLSQLFLGAEPAPALSGVRKGRYYG